MSKNLVDMTVIGKDHEGVVAGFTNFIFLKQGNIEKVNQNVVKGLFGMYLQASFAKKIDQDRFNKEASELAKKLNMDLSVHHHQPNSKKKVAILVTKEAHCLESLLDSYKKNQLGGTISLVIGTERTLSPLAKKADIPFVHVPEKDQTKAEKRILELVRKYDVDLIVLARYMRILSPNFVWRYPNRIINIHPSLLPAFPGAYAYVQAYERGAKIVGCTAHYATEDLDQGPIILQQSFPIKEEDTLESIKNKGKSAESSTLLKAVRLHLKDRLEVYWGRVHTKKKRKR